MPPYFEKIKKFNWSGILNIVLSVATVCLTYIAFFDEKEEKNYAALGEVNRLFGEIRSNKSKYCVGEELVHHMRIRYEAALNLLPKDSASTPPWNNPCPLPSNVVPPAAPSLVSVELKSSKSMARYKDWESFEAEEKKIFLFWIGDIPIQLKVDFKGEDPLKVFANEYEKNKAATKSCSERARLENSDPSVSNPNCIWVVDNPSNEIYIGVVRDVN